MAAGGATDHAAEMAAVSLEASLERRPRGRPCGNDLEYYLKLTYVFDKLV